MNRFRSLFPLKSVLGRDFIDFHTLKHFPLAPLIIRSHLPHS